MDRRHVLLVGLAGLAVGWAAGSFLRGGENPEPEHVLRQAELVYSDRGTVGLLPGGTSLHRVGALPEGIARYVVYVNVEGRILEEHPPVPSGLVNPLSILPARPATPKVTMEELASLITALQVTKAQMEEASEAAFGPSGPREP